MTPADSKKVWYSAWWAVRGGLLSSESNRPSCRGFVMKASCVMKVVFCLGPCCVKCSVFNVLKASS